MPHAVVLDASITASWLFPDEVSDDSQRIEEFLLSGVALVPPLWRFAMANVLRTGLIGGRLESHEAELFGMHLAELDIREVDITVDFSALAVSAQRWGLSAYDAAYLQLAKEHDVPLLSLDKKLREAALSEGVATHL